MAERGTRADIDLGELEKLASLHPTDVELASWFGVSEKTIERRKKEPAFAEALGRGRTKGKLNLRRAQMKMAETHPVMAIWLGKVILNQTEPMPYDSGATVNICVMGTSIDVEPEILLPSSSEKDAPARRLLHR
jgi:hypothetical protein